MAHSDYRLFTTIVEQGSLTGAAQQLGISAPMVSKRLSALEARLGVTLVNRTTRRLGLTERGAAFYSDVMDILAAAAAAERRASGQPGVLSGPLRVSAPTSFCRLHMAPYLPAFLEAHPGVALTIDLSDGFTDLIAERMDVAIRITAELQPGLVAHHLADSPRILCASPGYLQRHGQPASIRDLENYRLLAADGQFPWRLTSRRGAQIVDGKSFVRTNSSEIVRVLALEGAGIALRSLWDVDEDLRAGRLVRVLEEHQGSANVGIFAVHPKSRIPSEITRTFIDYLKSIYKKPLPWSNLK